MLPITEPFSNSVTRAKVLFFVGDRSVRKYRDLYVDRPTDFAMPLVVAGYELADLTCDSIWQEGDVHPQLASLLESALPPLAPEGVTDARELQLWKAVAVFRGKVWQHGANLPSDCVVVVAVGEDDVRTIASGVPRSDDLDALVAQRLAKVTHAIERLHAGREGRIELYVLGVVASPQCAQIERTVRETFNVQLRATANALSIGYLDARDPEATLEALLADLIARRSHALPPRAQSL